MALIYVIDKAIFIAKSIKFFNRLIIYFEFFVDAIPVVFLIF